MYGIHFYENNTLVLSQFLKSIPTVDENIKIKGRKGKVLSVKMVDENKYQVYVVFDPIIIRPLKANDNKKKK
jgi:hypothetical protein